MYQPNEQTGPPDAGEGFASTLYSNVVTICFGPYTERVMYMRYRETQTDPVLLCFLP